MCEGVQVQGGGGGVEQFSIFDLGFSIASKRKNLRGWGMTEQELKQRTKRFALRVMRLVQSLPKNIEGRAIGMQLVRSGMSVGANYRAACRAKSAADFVAKLAIVEEEADESVYWMELIVEGGLMTESRVASLLKEANELVAIATSSRRSASLKVGNRKS
jgi:four helix bundle protein